MFPSFTGSARPKRQVNLSGRNSNPFAAYAGSRMSSSPQTVPNPLAQAQQERILRQQERERPPAAIKIQKMWRGHRDRQAIRDQWRQAWDLREGWFQISQDAAAPYQSEQECLDQLRLISQFASPYAGEDIMRLDHFARRYLETIHLMPSAPYNAAWSAPLHNLASLVIRTLKTGLHRKSEIKRLHFEIAEELLRLLESLSGPLASWLAMDSSAYFKAMAGVVTTYPGLATLLSGPILSLLHTEHSSSAAAYEGFVSEFLCSPDLVSLVGLDWLGSGVRYRQLAEAVNELVFTPSEKKNLISRKSRNELLWLLACFIHFRRTTRPQKPTPASAYSALYVKIVSKLISLLADDIENRIDSPHVSLERSFENPYPTMKPTPSAEPLPDFVRSEIATLVNEENVNALVVNLDVHDPASSEDAYALASYVLMLLRIFPRRGDEIRMSLYRGSTSGQLGRDEGLPATKYFYQATRRTQIFKDITNDPRAAVGLLQPVHIPASPVNRATYRPLESRNQQWRVILLFLELYTFPLRLMDDEEFHKGSAGASSKDVSWTRQSALPLDQVEILTIFLKNLAFSMYMYAPEIAGSKANEANSSLAAYFGRSSNAQVEQNAPKKRNEMSVAGVSGLSVGHVKGMVTGVLRMLYERDSRRKFLPNDHWLMTDYFDMDRFISAVVLEEDERHQIERSYAGDGDDIEPGDAEDDSHDSQLPPSGENLIGTSRIQQVRNSERLMRQQRQASRTKYLESVTPRLEILQNMPFFIPFDTRIQIFREFVKMDQLSRRHTTDVDEWRFVQMNSPTGSISRHRGKVRRKHIFEDAYHEFYDLKDGLKEPIQIRFVDEFDTVEEGIDGGGVTKEFLTSITSEAFGADDGQDSLFIENDQHLLYPNPTVVEERKESMRQAMYVEGSIDWQNVIRELLRRYEFLGRIIGKCLYEGVLVDIHFAPFFLLKWALTGGKGAASQETGYRGTINDLYDLDKDLYKGLLKLKNYPGNVEDFSLNFAVTDKLRISPTESKTITHDLQPGGSEISVTNQNRLIYISYIARYRLQNQPKLQTQAFLRGLGDIISPSWLSMFNQSELQTLVGGTSIEVNVADLRANTHYAGVYAIGDDGLEHPTIQLFWKVMQGLDDSERKKLLKFVTSTPRAPLLGFKNLNPGFTIRDSGGDQARLPTTSTCVNLLKLPIYRDEETLRKKLSDSVNSGAGFNLS